MGMPECIISDIDLTGFSVVSDTDVGFVSVQYTDTDTSLRRFCSQKWFYEIFWGVQFETKRHKVDDCVT